jgi:hypothetical protein
MKMKTHLIIFFLATLVACGKGGGSNNSSGPGIIPNPLSEEETIQGSYRAVLRPLNNHLSGFLPSGMAEIKISGNAFSVKTLLDDDARVIHMQSVHEGVTCPRREEHDLNQDGLIDIVEAKKASGEVYIPLDSDLNSARAGSAVYPLGGNYTYIENASLSNLMEDMKIRTNRNLKLTGRVVLIHGVETTTKLPRTVATINGMPKAASIPIACGVLIKEY